MSGVGENLAHSHTCVWQYQYLISFFKSLNKFVVMWEAFFALPPKDTFFVPNWHRVTYYLYIVEKTQSPVIGPYPENEFEKGSVPQKYCFAVCLYGRILFKIFWLQYFEKVWKGFRPTSPPPMYTPCLPHMNGATTSHDAIVSSRLGERMADLDN